MEDALNRILQSIESLKSDLRNSLSYEQQQSILAKLNELREDVVSFQTMQVNNNNNNNVNLQNETRELLRETNELYEEVEKNILELQKELLELKNESLLEKTSDVNGRFNATTQNLLSQGRLIVEKADAIKNTIKEVERDIAEDVYSRSNENVNLRKSYTDNKANLLRMRASGDVLDKKGELIKEKGDILNKQVSDVRGAQVSQIQKSGTLLAEKTNQVNSEKEKFSARIRQLKEQINIEGKLLDNELRLRSEKSSKTSSVGRTLLRQIWSSDEKERELESRIAMLLAQGEEHVLLKKELSSGHYDILLNLIAKVSEQLSKKEEQVFLSIEKRYLKLLDELHEIFAVEEFVTQNSSIINRFQSALKMEDTSKIFFYNSVTKRVEWQHQLIYAAERVKSLIEQTIPAFFTDVFDEEIDQLILDDVEYTEMIVLFYKNTNNSLEIKYALEPVLYRFVRKRYTKARTGQLILKELYGC